jgi:hypothetical protein
METIMAKPATGKSHRKARTGTAEIIELPQGDDLPANDNGPLAAVASRQDVLPAPSDALLFSLIWMPVLWPTAVLLTAWTSWYGMVGRRH